MFSNLQAAIALSTRAQNVLQTGWPAMTWLYHIYGRLPCSLHIHKTRLQTVIETRQNVVIFDSRAATALSTHVCTKRFIKRNVWEEKCAAGAKNMKYKS